MFDVNLAERYKMNKSDFTRNRKQSFAGTVVFLMNMVRKTLAVEIESFVGVLNREAKSLGAQLFTKSAFTQCRKKISPAVFKNLSDSIVEEFYTDNDESVKLWNGFRLLAVDGSKVRLPNTELLREEYGTVSNQNGNGGAQARISVLYDLLNGFVIDGVLSPLKTGEHKLAHGHAKLAEKGDLVIYDRGYPSFSLVFEHNEAGADFLIRARKDFSNMTAEFFSSGEMSAIREMTPGKNRCLDGKKYSRKSSIKVRLIRVELDSGEDEILISSLLDMEKFPNEIFKDLYFRRWRVETYYDEFKNNLRADIFTGYSAQSIQQDFNAALFISNLQNLIVNDAEEELSQKGDGLKYKYKVNRNTSYGFMKDRVVSIFFSDRDSSLITRELRELFLKNTVPIRPGRTNEREVGKYRNKERPKNISNRKNAI